MDLQNLIENKEKILKEISKEINHKDAKRIRYEINWLLSKFNNSWATFEDAYMERISEKNYSTRTKDNKKYYFRYICKKLYPDSAFMPRTYCKDKEPSDIFKDSKGYLELNQEYQELLNTYIALARTSGKKEETIFIHCSLTTVLLRHLQKQGVINLEETTDNHVLSFFYIDSQYEQQIRSYSYKEKLVVVFKTCMVIEKYRVGCRHILNMIPSFGYVRKNVKYLDAFETTVIRDSIDSERLSTRERAIMMLLFYTGLRSCDVASVRLCDINWKAETLSIIQQKTAEPLEIPMLPVVGNAVFEYLCMRRPSSLSDYLFYEEGSTEKHISAKTVRNVANKVYRLAGIRQNKGDRKGTHLFRHHVATKMLENRVSRSVISKTLGHTAPSSLEPYLHADFKHLRELALSLEAYPVSEEVWNI